LNEASRRRGSLALQRRSSNGQHWRKAMNVTQGRSGRETFAGSGASVDRPMPPGERCFGALALVNPFAV
jgi:hypothetical protein